MRTAKKAPNREPRIPTGLPSIRHSKLQDLVASSPRIARLRSIGPAPLQAYNGKLSDIAGSGAALAAAIAAEMDVGSIEDRAKREAMLDRAPSFAQETLADDTNRDITFYSYFFRLCDVVARENGWDEIEDDNEFSDDDLSDDDSQIEPAADADAALDARGRAKWASDDTGALNAKKALKKRLKRFHKYVMTVMPEEHGQMSLAELMRQSRAKLDALPVAEEDITDGTRLMSNLRDSSASSSASAAAAGAQYAPIELEEEEAASSSAPGDFDDDGPAGARLPGIKDEAQFIDRIFAKARARFIHDDSKSSQLLLVALAMAHQEIHNLRRQHKGLRSAMMALGVGGPATYLEEKILPVVAAHMPTHIKEFVPPGSGRKRRGAFMSGAEGVTDMGWNTGTSVADVFTGGAASLATAGVGAGYKAGYAASAAKRSGAGPEKVAFISAATAIFEFVQGLIPVYSGVVGATGGARGLWKAVNPFKRINKAMKKRRGFVPFRNEREGGGPIDAIFLDRIARGEALLAEASQAPGSKATDALVAQVAHDVAFLKRQFDKLYDRGE